MSEKLANIGNLPAFLANNLAVLPKIKHAFLTRQGGVSKNEFSSLNLATPEMSLDDGENIAANMQIVARSFGIKCPRIFTVKQVHEADIYIATSSAIRPEPIADAIITQEKGLLIGVKTADCVPILLSSGVGDMVAAIHAGWPSTYALIIQKTIDKMVALGAKRHDIIAAVGPAIGVDSYEVGKEMMIRFAQQNLEYSAYFMKAEKVDHYQFNLSGLVAKILHNCGVRNLNHLQIDTYKNADLLFSHRRMTHEKAVKNGRQLSAIMIRD